MVNHEQEPVLVTQNSDHTEGSATADTKPSGDRGTLHVQGGQMNFVDSSHWLSILHDIKEVRGSLSTSPVQGNDSIEASSPEPETDLVFGTMQLSSSSLREIIWSLPSRPVCDSLLSQYFNMQFFVFRKHRLPSKYILLILSSYYTPTSFSERV